VDLHPCALYRPIRSSLEITLSLPFSKAAYDIFKDANAHSLRSHILVYAISKRLTDRSYRGRNMVWQKNKIKSGRN
jgi:hypothetical protein